jgi:predicted NBD/HSP70 family sugar kinase
MAPSIGQKKDYYIGVDVGDTYLNAGVVSTDGSTWAQRHQDVPHENLALLTQRIVATVSELRQMSKVGRYLGMTIANLINFLNVETVVLGGSVMDVGEVLLRPTIEEAKRRALSPPYDDCKIVAGSLGTSAGVIGASLMARDILTAGIGP